MTLYSDEQLTQSLDSSSFTSYSSNTGKVTRVDKLISFDITNSGSRYSYEDLPIVKINETQINNITFIIDDGNNYQFGTNRDVLIEYNDIIHADFSRVELSETDLNSRNNF